MVVIKTDSFAFTQQIFSECVHVRLYSSSSRIARKTGKHGLQTGCEKDKKRVSEVIGNEGEMPAEVCLDRGKSRLSCLRVLSPPDVSKHSK